ncbi:MAG: hypothetical protein JXC33_13660 [Deltaproteobacteria bacterium]|nr:hypothetical protein [Deltaproteobacteria bacterium]
MNDLRKWRFRFVVIALVVGGFLGWIALQQSSPAVAAQKVQTVKQGLQMLPASAAESPGMEKLKETKAVPTKARKLPTRDSLLQQVAKQPGGQEKVQKAKAKQQSKTVLRASSAESPEMEKLKDTKAVPTKARTLPSRKTLLQQILNQPDGKEKIQKANPKGFKLGAGLDTTEWSLPSLSYLNPFQAGLAHASDGNLVYLTPDVPHKSSPFYAALNTAGEMRGNNFNRYPGRARLFPYYSNPSLGTDIRNPYAKLTIRAPASGWYMINFETYPYGAKAKLKHQSGSSYRTIETVQTYDLRSHRGFIDHPALVNLSAGYHHFYWVVESGTSYEVCLYRVSVEKM